VLIEVGRLITNREKYVNI